MPISIRNDVYQKVRYDREDAFEDDVRKLADQIFGAKTVYIDLKKKHTGKGITVIPDGYLLDFTVETDPKFYIVENEIVSHDPFTHIGVQMLKFATSFDGERVRIRNLMMDEIAKDERSMQRLQDACTQSNSRNIDNYLDQAIYTEFSGLVLIDEAKNELFQVLEKINANISVLELKAYQSEEGELAYEFDTLYEDDDENSSISLSTGTTAPSIDSAKRRKRRAECDTIIVPAREDGFVAEFLNKNQWFAIRIGAAAKDRTRYIAAYQVAPISAVTHYAEIQDIKPYRDTGKYIVFFKEPAKEIGPVSLKDPNRSPQGPIYVKLQDLLSADYLDDAISY
jgi:hypothetical protein